MNPLVSSYLKNNRIFPHGSCFGSQRQPWFCIVGNLNGIIQIRCQFDFLCTPSRSSINRVICYIDLPLHTIQRYHNSTIGTVISKHKDFALNNRIRSGNRNRSLIRGGSIYFDFPTILCNGFDNRIFGCIRNRVGDCFALSSIKNGYIRCIECNCKLWIIAFRNRDNRIVLQCEIDIIIIFSYTFEDAIRSVLAIDTIFSIRPVCSIFSVFSIGSRCLPYIRPSFTIIHWKHPATIFYFQLRCNSILSVFSIRSIYTIFSVHTVISILAINSVLAVCSLCLYLISFFIGQPFTIKCPIIDAVRVFLHTNNRSVLAIFPVFNCSSRTIWKVDNVTIGYLFNFGNRQIILQCFYNLLQRWNIRVHLFAEFLQFRYTIFEVIQIIAQCAVVVLIATPK